MELQPYATLDPAALGTQLQEARKARRFTQQQVADALGVARTTIVAMEKGERRVLPDELVRLADLFGREVHELIRQRPVRQGFSVLFRTRTARDEEEAAERDAYAIEFQRLCENYLELEELCGAPLTRRYPPEYGVRGTPVERAAEDIASEERNRLGLGDGPVVHLRELLENDIGLRVFYMELPSRTAGIFCYNDELGGCIAVNARHPEDRCRWSLAHEFGHFLTGRYNPDISILPAGGRLSARERLADGFAKYFLLPSSGLSRRFTMLRRTNEDVISPADLLTLADYFHVSFEALLRRLEELRLLPGGTWERLQDAGLRVREAKSPLALASGNDLIDRELLPIRYKYLAVEAFQRAELTEGQLARYLHTDRLAARAMVQNLGERPDLSASGEAGVLEIDFSQPIVATTA